MPIVDLLIQDVINISKCIEYLWRNQLAILIPFILLLSGIALLIHRNSI